MAADIQQMYIAIMPPSIEVLNMVTEAIAKKYPFTANKESELQAKLDKYNRAMMLAKKAIGTKDKE